MQLKDFQKIEDGSSEVIPSTDHPQLQIFSFGAPEVYIDSALQQWRTSKSIELFFYLLHKNGTAHKDEIIDSIWSQAREQNTNVFHLALFYLRKVLGKNCIIFTSFN